MSDERDDGLTDEERAALELDDTEDGEDQESDNGEKSGQDDAGADDNNEGDGGEEDGDGATGDTSVDGGEGNAETDDSDANKDGQPEGSEQSSAEAVQTSAPLLVVQAPADAEAKLAEIAKSKEDLAAKFDDGDITVKEYQTELDKLNEQKLSIEFDLREAKLAEKLESQRQANEWNSTVNQFIEQNPRYNPKNSEAMYKLLDLEVRRVAVTDEFKNRTDASAGREILQKAHENLAAQIGFEAKPQSKTEQKQEKPQVKKPNLPPSLHGVPAAENTDTNGGKYASLDRLATTDPIAYEEALMKLSDGERAAYLATA